MKWTDELSVKINIFDDEHKKLIDLVNKLHDAMSKGQGQKAMADILVELSDYTKIHFGHEEDAMVKYNYPSFPEQKEEHDQFIKKLNDMQTQYKNGSITLSIPIFNFLTSWIQDHIKKLDKSYSEFFIKQGMR
ncbi:MAG: bacteriohemerythrin [Leptospirales bacterium]|nr:bacteriohemerythrin [Leptospirales bacterium]